ncbi:MAG: hypothetical protein ACRDHE_07410, partial [Ktedonobacterales bacterium]
GIPRAEFMLGPTYGHPVVYWEWLAQTFYALANRAWGLNGVVALAALLVAASSVGLYIALRRRGVALILALALTVAGIGLTSITWTARAQLFSLPLTLLWSELLWRYWRSGDWRILWTLPAIMALWANLHGGFLAGFILLATTVAVAWLFPAHRGAANPRDLTRALLGCALATLLNPWGLGLWGHILTYAGNPLIARYTQEYQSPDFHTLSGLLFLGLVFAITGAWLRLTWLRSRRASDSGVGDAPANEFALGGHAAAKSVSADSTLRLGGPEPVACAHVAVWTALAFTSVRFVPLWALIALPILGEAMMTTVRTARDGRAPVVDRLARRFARLDAVDRQVGRGVWSALAGMFVLVTLARGGALPGASSPTLAVQFDATIFPVAAVAHLRAIGVPPGQGFTTFAWGGYLDEALPEYHMFIDSRSDAYSQRMLADYADIVGLAPDWQTLLDRYGVHWALLPTTDPLTQLLEIAPDWRCGRADAQNVAMLCRRAISP